MTRQTAQHDFLHTVPSGEMLFGEAFQVWISQRTILTTGERSEVAFLAQKTERDYRVCAKALGRFFAAFRLDKIRPTHLLEYQRLRATNPPSNNGKWRLPSDGARREWETRDEAEAWLRDSGKQYEIAQTMWAAQAGANCIRKELALLVRILRAAKLWGEIDDEQFVRVRPKESDITRAMTTAEQQRFLKVAGGRPEWRLIYQYAIVALQTTAGTNELRALRLGDVQLGDRPIIHVPRQGAKNKHRMRTIPLPSPEAVWAMDGLLARARELGAWRPSDYVFPFQPSRTHYDPTRPMSESGLKKPWDAVRKAAGLPNLRIYDLRHTGITRMAERGVPLPVAMTFAGHMTQRMQQHYTSICMSAAQEWGAAVWGNMQGSSPPAPSVGYPPTVSPNSIFEQPAPPARLRARYARTRRLLARRRALR